MIGDIALLILALTTGAASIVIIWATWFKVIPTLLRTLRDQWRDRARRKMDSDPN